MPSLRRQVRRGDERAGGVTGYPSDALFEEVAFLAYYLHWPYEQIMNLDHRDRRQWIAEVSKINRRLNEAQRGA